MKEYFALWNAHDAAGVSAKAYRFEASNPMSTPAGIQANFDQLKAQGYDHSTMASVEGCLLSETQGLAELRYTRWKTDGTPLGPKDRAGVYVLRKYADGWRITQILNMDVAAHLNHATAEGRPVAMADDAADGALAADGGGLDVAAVVVEHHDRGHRALAGKTAGADVVARIEQDLVPTHRDQSQVRLDQGEILRR